MGLVPTIDLTAHDAPAEIDRACRDVGFFQIVGHGVDTEIERAAWDAATAFFRLPLEDKVALSIPDGEAYGYGPFAVERLAASRGEHTPPDLKETFSVGPFVEAPAAVRDDPAAAFVYSPNRWPDRMPDLEAVMHRYYDAMADLVDRLMSAMAIGLGMSGDFFTPFTDRHTSALRSLHYPDLTGHGVEPGQLRAGAHSDYGTLTLLRQDDAPGGLEVRDVRGDWHPVPPVDGAYVVNVGDALERWTNDAWRSTLHRVVAPTATAEVSTERQSMAFFHNANWDARIECIPTCLGRGERPRHDPITAGRHLMDKFRSTQY